MLTTQRALCPRCGAPLCITDGNPTVECSYCGCRALVERRLRTVEPDPSEVHPLPHLKWVEVSDTAHCAGCGAPLDYDAANPIAVCRSCATENRIHRCSDRLVSTSAEPGEDDPATLALIWKALKSPALADRVVAAGELLPWGRMNATLARRMPAIMRAIQESGPELGFALSRLVGRLLCTKEKFHHECVLESAREVVFRSDGSRALLFEIGLGPGMGLKLLLDVAEWACDRGEIGYGCTALWGANQIFQRHYDEHPVLREILLYRLPYLEGPVLGWAARMVRSQLGVAMRYPVETLLPFVDEVALERPEVAADVALSLQEEPARDQAEYSARLDRLEGLRTTVARKAALRMLHPPPAGTSLRAFRRATDLLLGMLTELTPEVVEALKGLFDSPAGIQPAVHTLVEQQGDELPEDFRRLYLERVPDCPHLSSLPVRYWQSSSRAEPLDEVYEAYRAGISLAVDEYRAQERRASEYARRLKNRSPMMAAAARCDADKVRELLASGESPDDLNEAGWSALMFAAEAGCAEVVAVLRQAGARIEVRDPEGRSVLDVASSSDVLKALGPALGEAQFQHLYALSCQRRDLELMRWSLEAGADPDILDEEGKTPLAKAIAAGDQPLVGLLREFDALE